MKKDNIELPPLPDNDAIEKVVYARTRVFIPLATYDAIRHMMQEYSIEAIKADRQQRGGEPVAWMTSDKRHIAFGDRLTKEEAAQHGWTPLYTAMVCDEAWPNYKGVEVDCSGHGYCGNDSAWVTDEGELVCDTPMYWMPLPQPPK